MNRLRVILFFLVVLAVLLVVYQRGWIDGYKYRANQATAQKLGRTF
jgi:hypothetical protein